MKRIEYLDALRGWAIYLVILGHSIQQLNDNFYFLNDKVFSTIYSFHMPLFFFLSGLLFKNSLKQPFVIFVSKKLKQLIVPCIIWAVIFYLVNFIGTSIAFNKLTFDVNNLKKIIIPSQWPFWFLVELFKSYVLLYILFKITKNQFLTFILALILVFLMHSQGAQRFLLPFFIVGIMTKDHLHFFEKRLKLFLAGSLFFFTACLFFWKGSYTIYFSEFPEIYSIYTNKFSFKNYDIALFRYVIGLFGCYFWFCLFKFIFEKQMLKTPMSWFSKIGKETLGIYILQKSFLEIFLTQYIDFYFFNRWLTSLVILPIVSIVIIQIIMLVIDIINRNKIARLLLIGKE